MAIKPFSAAAWSSWNGPDGKVHAKVHVSFLICGLLDKSQVIKV
nr:MAG TPA: hypothetical protein [Caudoviricetes sp.]